MLFFVKKFAGQFCAQRVKDTSTYVDIDDLLFFYIYFFYIPFHPVSHWHDSDFLYPCIIVAVFEVYVTCDFFISRCEMTLHPYRKITACILSQKSRYVIFYIYQFCIASSFARWLFWKCFIKLTRDIHPALFQRWVSVADDSSTLNEHLVNVSSYLLRIGCKVSRLLSRNDTSEMFKWVTAGPIIWDVNERRRFIKWKWFLYQQQKYTLK